VAFAGTQKNNNMGIYTPRGRMNVTTGTAASPYFDLQVYDTGSAHYGYLAYYDNVSGNLMITANAGLMSLVPTPASGTTPTTGGTWTSPTTVDTGAGAYVAMTVDPIGGIHLAYQDTTTGYLKYAYMTFNGTAFTLAKGPYTVDALLSSGQYNSITIRDFDATVGVDYRPIITTYSSVYAGSKQSLRMLYPIYALSSGSFGAGADSNTGQFTGKWESLAVRGATSPQTAQTFIDTTAATFGGYGKPHIGYNGSYPEEAELQDNNL